MREEQKKIWKSINEIWEELRIHREILKEHDEILKQHDKHLKELRVVVGSMGGRWGRDLERTVLEIYRDELIRYGVSPEKVKLFTYVDGRYGPKGVAYEFDIVAEDDGVTVIEVKSRAERGCGLVLPQDNSY